MSAVANAVGKVAGVASMILAQTNPAAAAIAAGMPIVARATRR